MLDDQQQTTGLDAQPEQPTNQSDNTPQDGDFRIEDLPAPAQALIKSLRDEAAARRVALKTAEEEKRKQDQARLVEEGNFKALADGFKSEAEALKPYKERAEALETLLRASNEARISRIPEQFRSIVPVDYAPEKLSKWLDDNATKLVRPTAPSTDAGAGSGGGRTVDLSADEIAVAKKMGLTPEEYAKHKKK
jgi:phage I-like protein